MELTMSNIRPLHDRVVIRRVEEETKTAGGILFQVLLLKNHLKVKSLQ
jgi:co-chaperonin GroES (HSP10)